MKKISKSFYILFLFALLFLTACQSYKTQVVPFKMPAAYPNVTEAGGAAIAAKTFDDKGEAEAAFGFDIRGSGILPVQIIFDNKGIHPIEIVPKQTFLVDVDNNLWPILDSSLAYDRIEKKTELGKVAPEAAKGGFLGGTAGAIIGAAIGIVTGQNVGEAAMKGAALGAAAGLTIGGGKGLTDRDVQDKIRGDLQKRTLESRAIKPNEIAYGFVFFPGESAKAKELRLYIREADTNTIHSLIMKF